jgi:hypothetical protein
VGDAKSAGPLVKYGVNDQRRENGVKKTVKKSV